MGTPVISVEHLSKAYRLGQIGTGTLSRDINVWWAKVRGKPNPMLRIGEKDHGNREGETIWALKDINLEVEQGEVLGIIGRNGAGKSTLLKILSRVTAPTSGRVKVEGRIASLLEVGTGFHPDLTGRENIYLNGAILGMRHKEIDLKFDEIVDFSGVEEFIDTPVKRYSSGMYVRLAFAVAAHLEPEILLVDEVLAVGDAEFQKKCLGKMGDVANEGRTVLFVSHNMSSIQTLTRQALLLSEGKLVLSGETRKVIDYYLEGFKGSFDHNFTNSARMYPTYGNEIRICKIKPLQTTQAGFYFGQDLIFEIVLALKNSVQGLRIGATVSDVNGTPILTTSSKGSLDLSPSDSSNIELRITDSRLAPGTYSLSLSIGKGGLNESRTHYDVVNPGPLFSICSIPEKGSSLFRWMKSYGPIVHPSCFVEKRGLVQSLMEE